MSKLKVTTISDPDNDNTAITIDSSGNITVAQNATFSGSITGDGSNLTGISGYSDSDALDLFNATGSAPVYPCRGWGRLGGSAATIYQSANISSVTDVGVGQYKIYWTTPTVDPYIYSVFGYWSSTAYTAATYYSDQSLLIRCDIDTVVHVAIFGN